MMAQIIENWSKISGKITEISTHDTIKGYKQLKIKLEKSKEVGDFSNLAQIDEGTNILVNIPEAMFDDKKHGKGKKLTVTARKAAGNVYFIKNANPL